MLLLISCCPISVLSTHFSHFSFFRLGFISSYCDYMKKRRRTCQCTKEYIAECNIRATRVEKKQRKGSLPIVDGRWSWHKHQTYKRSEIITTRVSFSLRKWPISMRHDGHWDGITKAESLLLLLQAAVRILWITRSKKAM